MRLVAAVSAFVTALRLLRERGWRVTWIQGPPSFWMATRGDDDLRADDPLQLLGLLQLDEAHAPKEPHDVDLSEVHRALVSVVHGSSNPPTPSDAPPSGINEMKSLVYGLGRGAGIRLTPHRFSGDEATAALELAREVLLAAKLPPDSQLRTFVLARLHELQTLVDAGAPPDALAAAIDAYIHARLRGDYALREE